MKFAQLGSTPLQRTFPIRGWGVSCVSGELQRVSWALSPNLNDRFATNSTHGSWQN